MPDSKHVHATRRIPQPWSEEEGEWVRACSRMAAAAEAMDWGRLPSFTFAIQPATAAEVERSKNRG